MELVISLSMAIAPAIFLVYYYNKQDKRKPEPTGLIVKLFIIGLLITIPVAFIEALISSFKSYLGSSYVVHAFFRAFFVAALSEELFKFIIVKKYAYNQVQFDEIMDGIIYTVIASLGFACLENILYVLNGNLSIALIRAFTAIPLHALASGVMGFYIGLAKFHDHENYYFLKGLFIAIMIHGIYDFLLFLSPLYGAVVGMGIFPLLIVAFLVLQAKIKSAIQMDTNAGRI